MYTHTKAGKGDTEGGGLWGDAAGGVRNTEAGKGGTGGGEGAIRRPAWPLPDIGNTNTTALPEVE